MRQHPFLTDLGFTALNGVHRGVLRASEGHIGGSALGIDHDWCRKFLVHPEVDFTAARERKAAWAPAATRAEPANLWSQVVAADRPYGRYQHRSPRDIPLVLLEPR